ncbi:hypothetical protein GF337_02340 [candidate division KSB1 bacterium]|nr:hypothetical protein [candidate division KSB1 bacterium]
MSQRIYSRCWLHLMWATVEQQKYIEPDARGKISDYLLEYSSLKEIFMAANFVYSNHVHVLVDLPAEYTIDELTKLLKGRTANWVNENRLMTMRFAWESGFAAFSVSQSSFEEVKKYFANQNEYHRKRSYQEELEAFLSAYKIDQH